MDVTFLKSEMYFIPRDTNFSLQGETHNKEQNWMNWNLDGLDVDIPDVQEDSDRPGVPDEGSNRPGVPDVGVPDVQGDSDVPGVLDVQKDSGVSKAAEENPLPHKVHDHASENIPEVRILNP